MRIEMELPDDLVAALDRIAAETGTPRADLIRDAL
jgi:metal-responsive CopG/Arc/MetJ family transcriptional regulator